MDEKTIPIIIGSMLAVPLLMVAGMLALWWWSYRRVPSGQALVVRAPRGTVVVLGCARASDAQTLRELFGARCASALTSAVRMLRHDELSEKREELADRALERLGPDLDGYVADGVGIESIAESAA